MKFSNKLALTAIAASVMAATGCTSTVVDKSYDHVRDGMDDLKEKIETNRQVKETTVSVNDGIWLGGDSFKVSEEVSAPSALQRKIEFKQVDPISVGELVTMLSTDLGMKIVLTQDAVDYSSGSATAAGPEGGPTGAPLDVFAEASVFDEAQQETGALGSEIKFTLNYKGTITGLLDVISSKAGLFWRYQNGQIVIMRNQTKTYQLDIMPGKTEYTSNMISELGGGNETQNAKSVHETKTEIKPLISMESIEKSIKSMLSKGGQMAYSEHIGTVTVTDTPEIQSRVASYVKNINAIASKQIAIRTDVFEITSDENGDFDTNILALYDWKGDLNIGLDGKSLSFGVGSNDRVTDNRFGDQSKATLNLLRTNKNASLVTSSTVYAMNGQPTPFQQMDEIGYLEKIEVTTSEGSEPQVSLTPGKTSQGFSMMVMPRVLSDGRVQMKFAVDSSRINSIDEYGTETAGMIQLPNRSTNKYEQLVTVKSGDALMIAGLERTENSANINSMFGKKSWMLGGAQRGGKRKMMTMIVLTPYIMSK